MLSDQIKQKIRTIHKNLGKNLPNYQPRQQQNYLVAEIAKTLSGEYDRQKRICVIEAGTGTGKSLAYCLGVIPLAMAQNNKVVISTATVALQEQLTVKDLPFFAKFSELDFSFDIIKGRQRYACLNKLALFGHENSDDQDFQQLLMTPPSELSKKLLHKLFKAYQNKKWDGDKDSWPSVIPEQTWKHIVSDKHSCSRSMQDHRRCPFHQARDKIAELDVLIVNHSLLLADLELGGGKILSPPDKSVYIIDEGHHLPQVTRDFAAAQATTKGAKEWLDKLPKVADKLNKILTTSKAIGINLKIHDAIDDTGKSLAAAYIWLQQNHESLFKNGDRLRFENGELPDTLLRFAEDLAPSSNKILKALNKFQELLKEEVSEGDLKPAIAEPLFAELGFFINRVENLNKLWHQWCHVKSSKAAPSARWIEVIKNKQQTDYLLATSPIEVGFFLADKLWGECAGAVVCSATLTALNKFDFFRHQVGLEKDDGSQYIKVDSPFDYPNNAQLHLPAIKNEPSVPEFTDELIQKIPGLIEGFDATLVLFSSYWQMEAVATAIEEEHKLKMLVQGQSSRQVIIDSHKKAIDKNEPSVIFGTQSFSEGLDLPGKYLTNVIITKLPFAVPTSPVEEAHAEYIKLKGGNAFMELTIPQASKKLVQACGRLLRNENDTGRVVILDKRLTTKRYGKSLLDALPPFKRIID
jgi:ATP-dependent DNA helicase DinG